MRKLMWLTIGFSAGIAAAVWIIGQEYLWLFTALFLFMSLILGFVHSPSVKRKIIAFCMAGAAVGMCWFQIYMQSHLTKAKACDGKTVALEITVSDYGRQYENGSSATGKFNLNGTDYEATLFIEEREELTPGDVVSAEFYLRHTGYGSSLSSTYHQGDGINLVAYSTGNSYVYHKDSKTLMHMVAKLRHTLENTLTQVFPEDTAGFAKALLLGDSSGLSKADDNSFQNSGIRHIIAVSGLHISILFSFLTYIFLNRRYLNALIGIPVLVLFSALAGFTPSVVRACVMQALLIISYLVDSEYDPPTALSFAVLLILGINPLAITSVSFQLSVGCVVGIFLFSSKIHGYITSRKWLGKFSGKDRKAKLKRWAASSVSISLSAMVLTTPISAYYFGTVCTVGVITNLLTLWAVTYIFCGIIISLVVGFLYLPFAQILAWLVSWLMRYVLVISGLISRIPYSTISADSSYIVVWLLFAYVMLIVMLCSKTKKPILLTGCILCGLIFSVLLFWLEARQDQFRMTVLDVGQGQCIILQSGEGCYIVDCGGTSCEGAADMAAQTLRTQGIHQVDGLIVTHYDKDHVGGVVSLMSQVSVERLYLPDVEPEAPLRLELETEFYDKIQWVNRKQYLSFGFAEMTLIPGLSEANSNNSSTSILFQTEDCDILITGDLQAEGERHLISSMRLPEVEILVAGHHGADDSTGLQLLNTVKPSAVAISVGKDNNFGHPSAQTLHRFELFGCRVWRTDLNGTVIFRG